MKFSRGLLHTKKQKGFTLIELVLYAGILSVLLGVLSALFGVIIETQLDSQATSSVDQDGRYVIAKMVYDMRSSSSIVAPANAGQSANTLQITRNSINYTYSLNGSNNLVLTNNSTGEVNVLNGSETSVTGLTFQRLGNGGSDDTVRVNFTITSRVAEKSGSETRSFQTTLGRQ